MPVCLLPRWKMLFAVLVFSSVVSKGISKVFSDWILEQDRCSEDCEEPRHGTSRRIKLESLWKYLHLDRDTWAQMTLCYDILAFIFCNSEVYYLVVSMLCYPTIQVVLILPSMFLCSSFSNLIECGGKLETLFNAIAQMTGVHILRWYYNVET